MRDVQTSNPGRPSVTAADKTGRPGPSLSEEWTQWLRDRGDTVNRFISRHLNELKSSSASHSRLPEAVQYSLENGGKRLRAILVLECCQVSGGDVEAAVPAAIAVECVHTFSLIHDDLPAMDDDDLRRGQPANHKVFGEALAILAGDWLLAHAFAVLSSERVAAGVRGPLVAALADGTLGMIAGQGADIDSEGLEADEQRVEFIHAHKTACLIEACCRLGALSAGAARKDLKALASYGHHLGFAFQIADDLLDQTGTSAVLGKTAGKDAGAAKQTFPAACGVEQSRRRAGREIESALAALDPFGSRAENLRGLARYVIARNR